MTPEQQQTSPADSDEPLSSGDNNLNNSPGIFFATNGLEQKWHELFGRLARLLIERDDKNR